MTIKDPRPLDLPNNPFEDVQESIEMLSRVLQNEQYLKYAEGRGPLTASQLPATLASSEAFSEFIADLGWPTAEDANMEPADTFTDDEEFWQYLYLLKFPGHHDELPLPNRLNNFVDHLTAYPTFDHSDPRYGFTSLQPEMHRANVIAPDLFGSLREILESMKHPYASRVEKIQAVPLQFPEIMTAAHMAYKIASRLVTRNDLAIASRKMGSESVDESRKVRSIADWLRG